jgi:hypothetical protein
LRPYPQFYWCLSILIGVNVLARPIDMRGEGPEKIGIFRLTNHPWSGFLRKLD